MIRGARAAASVEVAAAAAQAQLDTGGGAVDAVIAGFFGAAGESPGVLFAPAVALCAGFGSGGRVFDGRAAQPGRGAPRPRGFLDDAAIPPGARVAAPRSIAMLMLLSSYRGKASLSELCRAGVTSAEDAGAKDRAKLIRKVGAAGVLALRSPELSRALLAAGGAVAGGALTAADIEEATPTEGEAVATAAGEGLTVYTPPPLESVAPAQGGDADVDVEAILACDGRGLIAALAYAPVRSGVGVPGFEVSIGGAAVPVRRGVTRLPPGTLLPSPAPVAIAVQNGGFATALACLGPARLDPAQVAAIARGIAVENALADLRDRLGARRAMAVVTDGKTARGLVV
jgi:gamma-glutamyltranspeptidase/glutathione hydrolase